MATFYGRFRNVELEQRTIQFSLHRAFTKAGETRATRSRIKPSDDAPGTVPTGSVTFTDTFQGTTSLLNGGAAVGLSGNTAVLNTILSGVGSHTITANYSGVNGSFVASSATTGLPVTAIVPTLTFAAITPKTYGNAPFSVSGSSASNGAVTYTVTSGPATISVSTVTITGAGTVTLGATQVCSGDYAAPSAATTTFTVAAAPLTVTANSQTKVYGAALPSLTLSYAGFVNGDTVASLTTQSTLTTTATAASSVAGNPYAITASGAANPNYSISYVAGSMTVTVATASVSPNAASKTYGTTDPAFTGSVTGFIASDNVQATYSRVAGETVAGGPYIISAVLTPSTALANYSVTYNTATLAVGKATLTATANNAGAGYGATPSLTGTLTGVVAGDGITASYTTTATSSSQPAQYPITPVLSDPNNKLGNYTAVLNNGTLTIGQDQATTTLQASATSIMSQSSVTFTAKVAAPNATPTGEHEYRLPVAHV